MNEMITSKTNSHVKEAMDYKDAKGNMFLVEGFHLVDMAVESGLVKEIYTSKSYQTSLPCYFLSPELIKKIAFSKNPEGIVALVNKKVPLPISSSRVLCLDGVSDPGNVGTLFRSALAFGFHDVLLINNCANPYNPRAISASQGAIFKLNIIEDKDQDNKLLKSLPSLGYQIVGTDLKSFLPLGEVKLNAESKLVVVLGNEARGVSHQILSLASFNVRIEMAGIDSLNVAMAGSIIMYKWRE
jgi:TrmH family RNA methyltransferase